MVEAEVIPYVQEQLQSWDCAFKGLETSDHVVGQLWGRQGAWFLLLDQIRDRMDYPETLTAVRLPR